MEFAKVIGGNLNMRKDTDVKSARVTLIPSGANVAVIEKGIEWCKVSYNEFTGYVMAKFLEFESESDDVITLSISREAATELLEALKRSLEV